MYDDCIGDNAIALVNAATRPAPRSKRLDAWRAVHQCLRDSTYVWRQEGTIRAIHRLAVMCQLEAVEDVRRAVEAVLWLSGPPASDRNEHGDLISVRPTKDCCIRAAIDTCLFRITEALDD